MTGVAQVGAQLQLNSLTRTSLPAIQSTAPTWFPGLIWVNTTTNPPILYFWNGVTWTTASSLYLALCTADPSGQTQISGITECVDSGYSRQIVTFTQASSAYPSVTSNASLIQFGPFNVNMSLPVQWVALVSAASGVNGQLHQTWTLSQQQQVLATQVIDVPANGLTITQS